MDKYLLDTNAYFEILKHITEQTPNTNIEKIRMGNCYISRLTKIEIVSVIGKYSRGQCKQIQVCDRVHEKSLNACEERYIIAAKRKWSPRKLHDWLRLEKDISTGQNSYLSVEVLDINEAVISEAEKFIQKALIHNFKSMDSMILGTAKAYSDNDNKMLIVTADKGLKAGLKKIDFPFMSLI